MSGRVELPSSTPSVDDVLNEDFLKRREITTDYRKIHFYYGPQRDFYEHHTSHDAWVATIMFITIVTILFYMGLPFLLLLKREINERNIKENEVELPMRKWPLDEEYRKEEERIAAAKNSKQQ